MEHTLRAFAAPAHAGPIEPKANEVANGAFHCPRADVEVSAAQEVIAHPLPVLGEMLLDLEQPFALALVARSGLRDGAVRPFNGVEYRSDAATAQQLGLLRHPGSELLRALRVEACTCSPELLDDVEPVEASVSIREVALLQPPDVLAAISQEERVLPAVAALVCLAA